MCGLAGISGFSDAKLRESLICLLGLGIDRRGGHAAGFVSLPSNEQPIVGRREGRWGQARGRFFRRAAIGHTTMMHARYGTCGARTIREAHPFEVRRNGAPVLWGAHNGVLHGTQTTARRYGRKHDVDSRELCELLADDALAEIAKIEGYGVLTWIEAANPNRVLLARLCENSDIYVASTKCGGLIWGSTKTIVHDALIECDLEIDKYYDLEIGTVYALECRGISYTDRPKVTVSDYAKPVWGGAADAWMFRGGNDLTLWDDETEDDELKRLEAEWTAEDESSLLLDASARRETLEEQWKREENRNAAEWFRAYNEAMQKDDVE